ncbi:hypothetical protein KYC5002_46370 [Archangium violaceum]|uniref:hypothetical protein n=1 Tax=Archangium violaceum TaxID=83451 RepID=UPI002B321CB0|nr:hypothetical protein KYC5002_46370 [Archangium gephyra]
MNGRRWWTWGVAGLLAAVVACGGGPQDSGESSSRDRDEQGQGSSDAGTVEPPPPPPPPPPPVDAGTVESDAGTVEPPPPPPPPVDAGTPDAGTVEPDAGTVEPDAGTVEPPPPVDAGTPDAGTVVYPDATGWTFLGPEYGAPHEVLGVTEDEGGNLWVAGGEEGLFLLRPGAATFERFTMDDGLHPYGYLKDGSAPVGPKYLKVLSVAGGPAGTVFVGYQGSPDCESNYYTPGAKNPNSYKSGDADKVTLTETGIEVVHYDISSGPGVIGEESGGREKLCSILRIVWDKKHGNLWFGANHGFAWGDPDYTGDPTCNGQRECSGVKEHAHPHINAKDASGHVFRLTDAYYGVAVRPDGDVWFGGANRSTRFRYMTIKTPRDFETARKQTENASAIKNRIDVWPDLVDEVAIPGPSDRVDDLVSGMALMPDGSVWVSSFARGLARMDATGVVNQYALGTGADRYVSALAKDGADDSVWAGHRWGGGLTRLKADMVMRYSQALGALSYHPVWDIQSVGSGPERRLLVAFGSESGHPGAIGIYRGE